MDPNEDIMDIDQCCNFEVEDYEEELYDYEEDNGDDTEDDVEDDPEDPGIGEAVNCVITTTDMQIDPKMIDYIDNIKHQIILLGKRDISNPKIHGNILGKGILTEKQRKLYKFINTVLQNPACIKRCDTWWAPNTIRNYRYAIRDYVTFMAESTIDGDEVDENNFEVDGIHIVKCMEALIQMLYQKAGGPILGFNRKLLTFKKASEGLQHLIALYKSSKIADERERERSICENEVVENLHLVKNYLAERKKNQSRIAKTEFR